MRHPYEALPDRHFWQAAVLRAGHDGPRDVYRRKFDIERTARFGTAGSCFARHLGSRLRQHGVQFVDVEPPPPNLPEPLHATYGYGLFSARYGNVYSAAQFRQLVDRAVGAFVPHDDVWENDGRFYDPFRPAIEPGGFGSADEVRVLRAAHLAAVRLLFGSCDVFLLTLGLTETWRSRADGAVYPACPGTAAGQFDPSAHVFRNSSVREVVADLVAGISTVRVRRPGMRFILTVSPVPIAATATSDHVLTANTRTKSVLRAACDEVCAADDTVDYFPGYDLVTAPSARGAFHSGDRRAITPGGIEYVLEHFLAQHGSTIAEPLPVATATAAGRVDDERDCEEWWMEAGPS
jgi:hypothetical protein